MSTDRHAKFLLYVGTYCNNIKLRMCKSFYIDFVLKIYFRSAVKVVYGFWLRKEKEWTYQSYEGRTLNVQYLHSYERLTLDKSVIHEHIREEPMWANCRLTRRDGMERHYTQQARLGPFTGPRSYII